MLADRYEIQGLLGEGGFAAVYRVRNLRLGRTEALKVLSQRMTEESDFAKRFEQEARVSASLDHPAIVKIYDYGVTGEIAWYSMQFFHGQSLASELASRPIGMEPVEVVEIAVSILDALEYSHARGVIHRDIKPDNILLDGARRPYLTDFGIAKAEDSLVKTRTGMLIGSPAYMAPEQIAGAVPDGRTDVYALGVTLYRMLTLGFPFSGDDTLRMAMKKLTDAPEPLLERRPDLRPELASVIMTALSREPAKRFATAGLMRRALEEYLQAFGQPGRRTRGSQAVGVPSRSEGGVTEADTVAWASMNLDPTVRSGPSPSKAEPVAAPEKKRTSARWASAAAATFLIAAGLAWWISHRAGRAEPTTLALAPSQPTAIPAPAAAPDLPTPAASVMPSEKTAAVPMPRDSRKREAAGQGGLMQAKLPSPVSSAAAAAAPASSAPPIRYCGTVEPTAYRQSTAQELPSGFSSEEGEMGRAPRPDSARIQIEITVRPAQPREDEPFEVAARLVNGGDSDLELTRVEESAVRAMGGFQPLGGVSLPMTVSVGGSAGLYRYSGVLRGGSTYFKELRVTDSLGDSWKTSVRLLPCPGT